MQYGRRGRARGRGRGARTSARMSTGGRPPASQRRSSRRPSAPSEDHSLSVLESTVSAGLSVGVTSVLLAVPPSPRTSFSSLLSPQLLGGSTAPSPEVPDTLMDNGYSTPSVRWPSPIPFVSLTFHSRLPPSFPLIAVAPVAVPQMGLL